MSRDPRSIEYINTYCRSRLGGGLKCDVSSTKGRVLLAGRRYERGTALFVEPPLLLVAEAPENVAFQRVTKVVLSRGFAHSPLWYWSALCSLTSEDLTGCSVQVPPSSTEQQTRLLLLCQPEVSETSPDINALTEDLWSGASQSRRRAVSGKLERLLAVWLLNCFEHSEDPVGFSTFFLPSFLSHSCRPNCMWHYNGDDFVLRAREDIAANEEVTVSYLSEEALLSSTASRRRQLEVTKHFVCYCERCTMPLDQVRGFTCPSCKAGEIFLDVSGPAPAPSSDGACNQCGFLANSAQVAQLCAQEAKVEELMQDWDRRAVNATPDMYLTDASALRLEMNFEALFSPHHWLRDRAGRHLVAYYEATDRNDLALPLAKRCVEFTMETFPGYSALHAWALETQGDLLLRLEGFLVAGPTMEAPIGAPPEVLGRAWRAVGPIYAEATTTLSTLFGEDHDFHVTMKDKYETLAQATKSGHSSGPKRESF